MLQLTNLKKKYVIGDFVQSALDGVSLNFRDNEFVAILGPSGSGKTTLLNIVGGLDRYDEGDLVINGVSTKKFKDRDWDAYRNHSIGFVFQSYNLIAHQSILSNVELALTISGISTKARKERAKKALQDVGLGEHLNKKPNQLSGGQMQRVAIARALVNNPDILLADEPTGALDTITSKQVIDLLKEVAKDRLVIMVTHNPELAYEYATRIVELRDGKMQSDSHPFEINVNGEQPKGNQKKRTSMSFLTALSLSFNNLWTKKGRTILTAFAGSIGIIGIALILALSGGVNDYIASLQQDTMSSYPITINSENIEMNVGPGGGGGFLQGGGNSASAATIGEKTAIYADNSALEQADTATATVTENNLSAFKTYLDDPTSEIYTYMSEHSVVYNYDVKFDVFAIDSSGTIINTNDSPTTGTESTTTNENQGDGDVMAALTGNVSSGATNFEQLMPGSDGQAVSQMTIDSYDVLEGNWPEAYNEVVLVLDENNAISTPVLYQLGLMTLEEYQTIEDQLANGEEVTAQSWNYEDVIGKNFQLITYSDYFITNEDGTFTDISGDKTYEDRLLEEATDLTVVGVISPIADATNASITTAVAYTSELTNFVIDRTDDSLVVKSQEFSKGMNVLTGLNFEAVDDTEKANQAKTYASNLSVSEKASLYTQIQYSKLTSDTAPVATAANVVQAQAPTDEVTLAKAMDDWLANNPDQATLVGIYDDYITGSTYEDNMTEFGKVSYDAPSSISLYTESFEDKALVDAAITNYNKTAGDENQITYTDYVALLTSSLTSMVNIITYVLIAFVSLSLVVSAIMIAIITHISVMERTKEIGILRAIGASKGNISQVFNAENFLIGFTSGLIGVSVTALLAVPISTLMGNLLSVETFSIALSPVTAGILVAANVAITIISGLWPAHRAAKQDPVVALRSE